MDYLCAKFGDFTFSHFGFIVWTNTQNHTQMPLIALLTQLTSVSNCKELLGVLLDLILIVYVSR